MFGISEITKENRNQMYGIITRDAGNRRVLVLQQASLLWP